MAEKKKSVGLWVISWLFGITFISLSIYLILDFTGSNIPNSVETKGTVYELYDAKSLRLIPRVGADDYYSSAIPKVEFITIDGKKVQFLEKWGVDNEENQYKTGQEVTVVYNSEFPEEAQIKQDSHFGYIHIILIILGIFMLFAPVLIEKSLPKKY